MKRALLLAVLLLAPVTARADWAFPTVRLDFGATPPTSCRPTELFFDMVEGESLRFVKGAAPLPQAPGLGIRLRRPTPPGWIRMDRPWLDPRLG